MPDFITPSAVLVYRVIHMVEEHVAAEKGADLDVEVKSLICIELVIAILVVVIELPLYHLPLVTG